MGERRPVVLVAGNPNVGKTTLFNSLTGLRHKVANYPGVTVEKRSAVLEWTGIGDVEIVDLPGTYSLQGDSLDEVIAVRSIIGSFDSECNADLIVIVVDASSLERNLFLGTQIIDIGKPVIIALNMVDIAERQGSRVYSELLAKALGVSVIPIVGSSKIGVPQLVIEMRRLLKSVILAKDGENLGVSKCAPVIGQWCDSEAALYRESVAFGDKLKEQVGFFCELHSFGLGLRALTDVRLVPSQLSAAWKNAVSNINIESDVDPISLETAWRYRFIEQIVSNVTKQNLLKHGSVSSRIDRILLHRVWGLLIFAIVMIAMFQAVFSLAALPMQLLAWVNSQIEVMLMSVLPASLLRSLLVDGVVGGVGSVFVFLPQIMILYALISLLEDSGYLARVAFLMDRIMRVVGLQGRSFVPLLNSFACAIPGILATRTIASYSDRMRTILIAPLMSCSARLPVYAVLISAFIPSETIWGVMSLQGLVLFAMYVLGVIVAGVMSLIFKFTLFRGEISEFVMELPSYKRPYFSSAAIAAWDRGIVFIRDAGSIILACSIIMWFLSSFPKTGGESITSNVEGSYAGHLGKFIEPVIRPLGFDWRIGVAIVGSFAAREVFVSTLSMVYNLDDDDHMSGGLIEELRASDKITGTPRYGTPVALSLMVFYCFCCQCTSTLAVCRRETGSIKWPLLMFVYMTVLAYAGAWLTYRFSFWWIG